ncbi:TPA: helix-turn-helix transcriptional regulator [Stenotrophomonas maltophilia]|nr:helix-turn-helix transcriptional regulator [Stenotrophomonas maltophilia]
MSSSIYAARLRQARLAAGLSQIKLGEMIGLDQSVGSPRISRYEKGHHTPDIESAKQIADTLGVPLPFFFAEDDRMARLILMYGPASLKRHPCSMDVRKHHDAEGHNAASSGNSDVKNPERLKASHRPRHLFLMPAHSGFEGLRIIDGLCKSNIGF